ncbi:hypothetical protein O6H91_22G051500 [Diphasiastrum complanatum]|uniref:Uncharacterized protein n=1 Tax=Diphasiastrum complanatum TaxID=34168 RepID=A0ACC2AFP7_DIPCM|nr:hypothetical protein O6H91_22G051500 [Diphasiastrum complanatum]
MVRLCLQWAPFFHDKLTTIYKFGQRVDFPSTHEILGADPTLQVSNLPALLICTATTNQIAESKLSKYNGSIMGYSKLILCTGDLAVLLEAHRAPFLHMRSTAWFLSKTKHNFLLLLVSCVFLMCAIGSCFVECGRHSTILRLPWLRFN